MALVAKMQMALKAWYMYFLMLLRGEMDWKDVAIFVLGSTLLFVVLLTYDVLCKRVARTLERISEAPSKQDLYSISSDDSNVGKLQKTRRRL